MTDEKSQNRYSQIIETLFFSYYQPGKTEIKFSREELIAVADQLNIPVPKNLGDVLYSFRYRINLPIKINATAPEGTTWIIRSIGKGLYSFVLSRDVTFLPRVDLVDTKIPDSTPGIITRYALSDEQALLAILRYNRLIDIFTGLTCYSLQNHLRTSVHGVGQVETDEVYIGIDKRGVHYVLPIQAKGGKDRLGVIQIEQDFSMCRQKFPLLNARCIGAQFMGDNVICLFEFVEVDLDIRISYEKHYRLVDSSQLSSDEMKSYYSHQ